jgi:hypothetical protein
MHMPVPFTKTVVKETYHPDELLNIVKNKFYDKEEIAFAVNAIKQMCGVNLVKFYGQPTRCCIFFDESLKMLAVRIFYQHPSTKQEHFSAIFNKDGAHRNVILFEYTAVERVRNMASVARREKICTVCVFEPNDARPKWAWL